MSIDDPLEREKAIEINLALITSGNWRAETYPRLPGWVMTDETFDNPAYDQVIASNMSHDDARFLAAAPADIRFLIDRVHALETVSEWPNLIRRLSEQQQRIVELEAKVEALEAENADSKEKAK